MSNASMNQLLHEFSELREEFEADLRSLAAKDKSVESSTMPELEATIRLMYIGTSS